MIELLSAGAFACGIVERMSYRDARDDVASRRSGFAARHSREDRYAANRGATRLFRDVRGAEGRAPGARA
jgi:hypothetical protein